MAVYLVALIHIEFMFVPTGSGANIVEQRRISQRLQIRSAKAQFATDLVGDHGGSCMVGG